jgi:hypothetical protein
MTNAQNSVDMDLFLKKSLENPNNMAIYNLTFDDIYTMKEDILKDIVLDTALRNKLLETLYNYRYVDNLNDLRDGSYLRWIHVTDRDIVLNKGALFCNIVINETGAGIVCKTIGTCRYFVLKSIDEYVFFQKLSTQELVILNAIDNIKK